MGKLQRASNKEIQGMIINFSHHIFARYIELSFT